MKFFLLCLRHEKGLRFGKNSVFASSSEHGRTQWAARIWHGIPSISPCPQLRVPKGLVTSSPMHGGSSLRLLPGAPRRPKHPALLTQFLARAPARQATSHLQARRRTPRPSSAPARQCFLLRDSPNPTFFPRSFSLSKFSPNC